MDRGHEVLRQAFVEAMRPVAQEMQTAYMEVQFRLEFYTLIFSFTA